MSKRPKSNSAQERMPCDSLDSLSRLWFANKASPPTAVGFGEANASTTKRKETPAAPEPRHTAESRKAFSTAECIQPGYKPETARPVSYTHLRAHETPEHLV